MGAAIVCDDMAGVSGREREQDARERRLWVLSGLRQSGKKDQRSLGRQARGKLESANREVEIGFKSGSCPPNAPIMTRSRSRGQTLRQRS